MKKPTDATYAAAIARLKNGFGLRETIRYFEHHFGVNIPPATLHRKWEKAKNETPEQQAGTMEQQTGTAKAGVLPDVLPTVTATAQNAVLNVENAVSTRSEQQSSRSTIAETTVFFARHFGLMDLAFYVLNGTACFAMWNTAPGVVGASMATIYCLFSLDAILRVKRADMPNTAGAAANRVLFLEVIAAIFHFRLIDAYLWQNLDKLPFSVYQTAGNGVSDYKRMDGDVCLNCYWHNGDWVHFIAGLMAFLMAAAACHAVFFAKQAATEAQSKQG